MATFPASEKTGGDSPRSRRRRLLTGLGIVAAVILVIYASAYAVSMRAFRDRVNANVQSGLGVQDAFRLTGSLAPLGLALQSGALTFNSAGSTGTAAGARIAVPLLTPWHVASELDDLRITTGGWVLAVPRVDSRMDLSPQSIGYRVTLTNLSMGRADAAEPDTTRAPHVVIGYTRRLADHSPAQPEETATLDAAPVLLPAAAAPKPGMVPQLDAVSWRITSEPAFPRLNATPDMGERRAALASWQQAGGAVTLNPLSVSAFGMTATLTGPLQLDPDLALDGKFALSLSGVAQAFDAIAGYNERFHMIPADTFQKLGAMLRLVPGNAGKSFSFQIGLRRHWLTFMNAPVYRYGPMDWELVPFSEEKPETATPAPDAAAGAAAILPGLVPGAAAPAPTGK